MRFTFNDEQEAFRREVVAFLEKEIPALDMKLDRYEMAGGSSREFSRKLAEKKWIGLTWPKEFGGSERGYLNKMILSEQLIRYRAPTGYHFTAERQIGPAIIKFGQKWQKDYFLPRFINAEDNITFCLLFSEPDAGSDLAAIKTTAIPEGDNYVINGQKVWSSGAHHANYGWLLARTNPDPAVPGHIACSEFILDLKTPGITIRPILNIMGEHHFNEVFFDNVKIDKKYLVGKENDGFKQIVAQLDYERAGIERLMQNHLVYERLKAHIGEGELPLEDPGFLYWIRDAFARLETEFTIGRLLCYQTAWMIDQGKPMSSQAALCKALCSQYEHRLNDVATRLLGASSLIMGEENPYAPWEGLVAQSYLHSPGYTLQGGAVEILKNIVAQRGLKLPRT
jgi:3-oxocholest-4-en-26-oyl-CoA dehydrogenase alpha subunit